MDTTKPDVEATAPPTAPPLGPSHGGQQAFSYPTLDQPHEAPAPRYVISTTASSQLHPVPGAPWSYQNNQQQFPPELPSAYHLGGAPNQSLLQRPPQHQPLLLRPPPTDAVALMRPPPTTYHPANPQAYQQAAPSTTLANPQPQEQPYVVPHQSYQFPPPPMPGQQRLDTWDPPHCKWGACEWLYGCCCPCFFMREVDRLHRPSVSFYSNLVAVCVLTRWLITLVTAGMEPESEDGRDFGIHPTKDQVGGIIVEEIKRCCPFRSLCTDPMVL